MTELKIENTSALYVTSDLHLNHRNIIKYCDRPWEFSEDGLNEMNHTLISNLLSLPCGSTLLNLGDWAMLGHGNTNRFMIRNIVSDLLSNGVSVITVLGNHDRVFSQNENGKYFDSEVMSSIFSQTNEDTESESIWYSGLEPVLLNRKYVLSHEPVFIKNKERFNLHGHIHNNPLHRESEWKRNVNFSLIENYINCCADVHDFKPVKFDELVKVE